MKAYLAITGTLFALIAILHTVKAIAERDAFSTNPGEAYSMTALGLLAASLSVWAWRLLFRRTVN